MTPTIQFPTVLVIVAVWIPPYTPARALLKQSICSYRYSHHSWHIRLLELSTTNSCTPYLVNRFCSSIHAVIQPFTRSTSLPSPLCVNSKSFSKSLFSLAEPSSSPGYGKWITGVSPIAGGSPARFILPENSFSMRVQFPCSCLAVDLLYILCICIHLWPVYLFVADESPPPLPLMGNFDKDRSGHLWDYWSSIYSEAFICSEEF